MYNFTPSNNHLRIHPKEGQKLYDLGLDNSTFKCIKISNQPNLSHWDWQLCNLALWTHHFTCSLSTQIQLHYNSWLLYCNVYSWFFSFFYPLLIVLSCRTQDSKKSFLWMVVWGVSVHYRVYSFTAEWNEWFYKGTLHTSWLGIEAMILAVVSLPSETQCLYLELKCEISKKKKFNFKVNKST